MVKKAKQLNDVYTFPSDLGGEIELRIWFYYQKGEPATDWYPGHGPSVEIKRIENLTGFTLKDHGIDFYDMEEKILEDYDD